MPRNIEEIIPDEIADDTADDIADALGVSHQQLHKLSERNEDI